jgi:nicotinamide-nucleotide amidase
VPAGATVLEPVGTAPGLVVPPAEGRSGPTVVVLPGPPRELQPMWKQALETDALRAAIVGAPVYRQRMLRLFGIPESEIAETLRVAAREGVEMGALEITTCLRGGEIEVVTRYEAHAQDAYDAFVGVVERRHADTLYSADGTSIDDQVASLLRGDDNREPHTIAVAESCTGGLLLGRLTNPPGASRYVLGGIVAYSNEAKIVQVGVPRETIERHGAVSKEVAQALADGARTRLGADIGVGLTGIAGPGGGSEQKPVGLVWFSVAGPDGAGITRSVTLPGGRADIRERAVLVAMHLIRRLLTD